MSDHYKTLGIKPSAQTSEIKKAYFDLAKKYHPDAGDVDMVKKFYEITEAYKILSDVDLKKAYDLTLLDGLEKIQIAQEEIMKKNPTDPTPHVRNRADYRDEELNEFHRSRFRSAVWKVVRFTLMFGVLGALADLILAGGWFLGFLAGILIGFSISIKENFDIETFFDTPKKQKLFYRFNWLILILGILYFVALVLFSIL